MSREVGQPFHQGTVRGNASCLHFDYEALKIATSGFNPKSVFDGGCKLGEGAFGPVFKGSMLFTDVAVKVLRTTKPVSVFECLGEWVILKGEFVHVLSL